MRYLSLSVLMLLLSLPAFAKEDIADVAVAASRHLESVEWQSRSVLQGDFSCQGKSERAILGISKTEIVVAIFTKGLTEPPEVLRYSAGAREPATAVLKTESMDFDPKERFDQMGYLPPGTRPSNSCVGLNLSDEKVDSAHIYWNHDAKQFSDWSL